MATILIDECVLRTETPELRSIKKIYDIVERSQKENEYISKMCDLIRNSLKNQNIHDEVYCVGVDYNADTGVQIDEYLVERGPDRVYIDSFYDVVRTCRNKYSSNKDKFKKCIKHFTDFPSKDAIRKRKEPRLYDIRNDGRTYNVPPSMAADVTIREWAEQKGDVIIITYDTDSALESRKPTSDRIAIGDVDCVKGIGKNQEKCADFIASKIKEKLEKIKVSGV